MKAETIAKQKFNRVKTCDFIDVTDRKKIFFNQNTDFSSRQNYENQDAL